MPTYDFKKIVLDYAGVRKKKKILANLSTVAAAGEFLWTASDEGRTSLTMEQRCHSMAPGPCGIS